MMIPDTIQTMDNLGVRVAYLPTRGTNLRDNPDKRPVLVEQLRGAGNLAVEAGVVFGIETTLTGEEEAALIDEIGSPGIKTYFNFKNPLEEGRDLVAELRVFGRERIVQIHCTDEDGELLRDNEDIDMAAVRDTLEEMGWDGWLVMERSRVSDMEHIDSFSDNAEYLKSFFQ
jgi:sugar phosphate isomerase/epimerase